MKHDDVFMRHILDEADFISKTVSGKSYESFIGDELAKRACTRSLEIIGEAVKNISPEFKKQHKEIDWRGIAGLRDKITHGYFGINWTIIWDALINEVPPLGEKIKAVLEETDKKRRGK